MDDPDYLFAKQCKDGQISPDEAARTCLGLAS
jgi:hypothetical protein